ncbi:MAG: polysaccharide deacetylase family protein [Micromonosporaceae bacterium]
MSVARSRLLPVAVALGFAGALAVGLPAAAAPPAAAATLPPIPSNEGPAGPPALMPNGRVAPPPQVVSPQVSTGCPAAPYGAQRYAPGSGKTVALTFDDGPGATTSKIISILRQYGVTATFFNLGQNAAANPGQVRAEARAGYMLGNHTWDHPNMSTLSSSAQGTEMDRATSQQKSQVGTTPCAFRPPGGSYNATTLSLAQQRNMKFWTWSVDTEDWKAQGSSSSYWVNRIVQLAEQQGGVLNHPVVLMHNQPAGNPATALALPTIIKYFRGHGYTFVDLVGRTGVGYPVLTSDGGVRNFGSPWYGSAKGTLPDGVTANGIAPDLVTGGYWVLKSDGGVNNYNAPWYGSLAGKLAADVTVAGIAAAHGGYLVLTSDGGVSNFGTPWHGSDKGKLAAGVTAVALAADPATGGYWILKSDGGVDNFNTTWYGSLKGKLPASLTVKALAAGTAAGYLILTSDGGVHNLGTPWYGSAKGKLTAGVTPVALAVAPATGGYWILKSDGGVLNYNAPWNGSLKGTLPSGLTVTAIAGE